ncbi:uncharacterized protein LOC132637744 [Lycium barbarum]|uniref:uncharacterized protein LOC132637744 n=1 Tax=Lycium barbarum TaxID=112863 RepID=UPI00293ECBE5|nr:uncharacterized protein LOC132637744 [Lycium barbarum]
MKDDESIQDMHTSFTSIINELHSLGELKIWIGNLKTYEVKKKKELEIWEPKKERNLVLKAAKSDSSGDESDMAYITKRFRKMIRKNGGFFKIGSSTKNFKQNDLCHKCRKPGHYIKECPFHKQKYYKNADKGALASWGDSSCESEDEDTGDTSMMAIEDEPANYESTFALMSKSEDEDDNGNEKVNFFDVQKNLKNYSQKKLISLANVLIDTFHSLINEKNVLNEDIEGLEQMNKWVNTPSKGKQVGSEIYFELDSELKRAKTNLSIHLERNRELQEDLSRVKSELDKSLHWTCSSDKARVRGSSQKWFVDSGCSKHMTGRMENFLSLKALKGGSVSFGNGKKGYILGIDKIGKTLSHAIENVYYVKGLSYSQLSVSQICNRGNKVEFLSHVCTITNLKIGDVVLTAKRYKNIYAADFGSSDDGDLTCLSTVDDNTELWHKRLGHASFTLLNKLVAKDLVRGLPNVKFKDHKVCDECIKRKQVRTSFKPKKEVITSTPLELLHMDLCGPMRIQNRGGKKYIFVIVDDISRFTWTLFLRTKDETLLVFVAFVK